MLRNRVQTGRSTGDGESIAHHAGICFPNRPAQGNFGPMNGDTPGKFGPMNGGVSG
jgi:hypothetical protein